MSCLYLKPVLADSGSFNAILLGCVVVTIFITIILIIIKATKIGIVILILSSIFMFSLIKPMYESYIIGLSIISSSSETTTTISSDSCEFFESSDCILSDSGEDYSHIPYISTNHWRITCSLGGLARVQTTDYINLTSISSDSYNSPVGSNIWYIIISASGIYEDVLVFNYTINQPYWINQTQCSS